MDVLGPQMGQMALSKGLKFAGPERGPFRDHKRMLPSQLNMSLLEAPMALMGPQNASSLFGAKTQPTLSSSTRLALPQSAKLQILLAQQILPPKALALQIARSRRKPGRRTRSLRSLRGHHGHYANCSQELQRQATCTFTSLRGSCYL